MAGIKSAPRTDDTKKRKNIKKILDSIGFIVITITIKYKDTRFIKIQSHLYTDFTNKTKVTHSMFTTNDFP